MTEMAECGSVPDTPCRVGTELFITTSNKLANDSNYTIHCTPATGLLCELNVSECTEETEMPVPGFEHLITESAGFGRC